MIMAVLISIKFAKIGLNLFKPAYYEISTKMDEPLVLIFNTGLGDYQSDHCLLF